MSLYKEVVWPHHCQGNLWTDESHHIWILPVPLLRKYQRKTLLWFLNIFSCHPIQQLHQGGEVKSHLGAVLEIIFTSSTAAVLESSFPTDQLAASDLVDQISKMQGMHTFVSPHTILTIWGLTSRIPLLPVPLCAYLPHQNLYPLVYPPSYDFSLPSLPWNHWCPTTIIN